MEENIYTWQPDADSQQQWGYASQDTVPSLRQFTDGFNKSQFAIRKAKSKQSYNDDVNLMNNLYEAQTSAKDKNVASESGKAIRKTQIAFWIRDFYNNNYKDELNQLWINLDSMTNWQVMDWYTELNPNSYDLLKDYIITERDINDPLELYYKMWIMPSPESISLSDRIKTSVEQIRNGDAGWYFNQSWDNLKQFWSDFAESELSWPTEIYYWLRNFVNWVQWLWDNDANWFWAIQNYAHEEMWKDISQLSTLELYWISEKLKNPEVFANYAPTPTKWWIETLAWFTDTLFSIAARPVKLIFSAADADPLTKPFMNILWWTQEKLMWEWLWWILTLPLEWYVSSMPENDRRKWYAWLGSVLTLWLTFKSKNSWPWANDLFRWVLKDLWRDKLVSWFEDKVLKPLSPTDIEWWIETYKDKQLMENLWNSDYYKSLPQDKRTELDLHSNKVLTSETIWENRDISRALMQLDQKALKTVKTYEDLFKLNKKELDRLLDMENTIAGTIEKKFWPEEDIWEWDDVTVSWKYKWETEPNRPIREFFDTMKLLIENEEPNIRKQLDWFEKKYLDWDIDVVDLLNFKRALSQQYLKYKYKKSSEASDNVASWKKPVWDSDIRRIYDWLNYLIRDSIEWPSEFRNAWLGNIMQTLDQRISPHLNLRTRLITMANALNKELWKIPEDILWRKAANTLRGLPWLSLTWIVRWLADKLTKSKEKMTNPTDYVENLAKSLKQITNILKEFPDEQRWLIMNSLAEYIKRKISWTKESYWWKVEWEVIEDPRISWDDFIDWESEFNRNVFLEDRVEVVPKESNMLWNDSKYDWNPVDYTNTTRVTPEWYAWRKWATSESYQWKPAWDFWTPAEFENRQWDPYERVIEAYDKAMDDAWFSEKQKARIKEELEKNGYKVKQQPSLFQDFPDKAETAEIVKSNKWQEWPKLDLKSVVDELKELEDRAKKNQPKKSKTESKTTSKSKKVSQEDIDHLFWKDKPELKKWKKSSSNPK